MILILVKILAMTTIKLRELHQMMINNNKPIALNSGQGPGVLCINLDRDTHLRTFSVCPKK